MLINRNFFFISNGKFSIIMEDTIDMFQKYKLFMFPSIWYIFTINMIVIIISRKKTESIDIHCHGKIECYTQDLFEKRKKKNFIFRNLYIPFIQHSLDRINRKSIINLCQSFIQWPFFFSLSIYSINFLSFENQNKTKKKQT